MFILICILVLILFGMCVVNIFMICFVFVIFLISVLVCCVFVRFFSFVRRASFASTTFGRIIVMFLLW